MFSSAFEILKDRLQANFDDLIDFLVYREKSRAAMSADLAFTEIELIRFASTATLLKIVFPIKWKKQRLPFKLEAIFNKASADPAFFDEVLQNRSRSLLLKDVSLDHSEKAILDSAPLGSLRNIVSSLQHSKTLCEVFKSISLGTLALFLSVNAAYGFEEELVGSYGSTIQLEYAKYQELYKLLNEYSNRPNASQTVISKIRWEAEAARDNFEFTRRATENPYASVENYSFSLPVTNSYNGIIVRLGVISLQAPGPFEKQPMYILAKEALSACQSSIASSASILNVYSAIERVELSAPIEKGKPLQFSFLKITELPPEIGKVVLSAINSIAFPVPVVSSSEQIKITISVGFIKDSTKSLTGQ